MPITTLCLRGKKNADLTTRSLLRSTSYGGQVAGDTKTRRRLAYQERFQTILAMDESLIEEELTGKIIGAAIEVHRYWGPGLVESIYEKSLAVELEKRAIPFKRQLKLELKYKDVLLDDDFRLDLIIGDKVVVELKVVRELAPIFEAQLLTYMRLTKCRVGLLMNFNVPVLKNGIKRLVL